MIQSALTIITRIKPEQLPALEKLLDEIGGSVQSNGYIPFTKIASLHFACWVILKDDLQFPPTLVFENNHDGDNETHLDEFIAGSLAGLNAIYSVCEDYSFPTGANPAQMKRYLLDHSVACPAFYVGVPGQSLVGIRNAIAVRTEIEAMLDSAPMKGLSQEAAYARIVDHIRESYSTKPIVSPETLDQQSGRAKRNIVITALIGLPILILVFPFLIVWFIMLRMHETKDLRTQNKPSLPIDPRLFEKEDIFIQNHLTTLVNVKPGAFRLYTLKTVLWLINLLAKTYFITGHLGGIPTIHFARWILMDNDRRLLFFSNYDGSWASYLGDFVDKANYGLTGVWSNTENFPPAKYLFVGGAQHIEEFKQWSREHNIYPPVWYSAYPDETLWNLQKDIRIRDTAGQPLQGAELEKFLQLL